MAGQRPPQAGVHGIAARPPAPATPAQQSAPPRPPPPSSASGGGQLGRGGRGRHFLCRSMQPFRGWCSLSSLRRGSRGRRCICSSRSSPCSRAFRRFSRHLCISNLSLSERIGTGD
jgi:hypothetical protein